MSSFFGASLRTIIALRSGFDIDLPSWLPWAALLLASAAEWLIASVSPVLGLTLHALLLIGLILCWVAAPAGRQQRLILALVLVPLIRLFSVSLPLARLPQMAWYPSIAIPLLISAWICARVLDMSPGELGLRLGNPLLQLLIAFSGLGIGVVQYIILRPKPQMAGPAWLDLVAAALILIIFTGFMEEFIVRGLILPVAWTVMGRQALIYVSLLFTALHIGYHSAMELIFVFGVSVVLALFARSSGSILGIALAHGLANVTLYLIMPSLVLGPTGIVIGRMLLISGGMAIAAAVVVLARPYLIATPER